MEVRSFQNDRDDLCERLGGGLPRGTLVVMEGPFGAGKSILSQRMTYGLINHGHSVTYVSTELTTAGFLDQMDSLDYQLEGAIMKEDLVFIPLHPVLGARAPREELLNRVLHAQEMYEKDVILFDTFSKFIQTHLRAAGDGFDAMESVEASIHLFKRLTSIGRTVILTFEKGQVPDSVASAFKEAADILLTLDFEIQGGAASRRIIVNRMGRAAGRFGEIIGFRVEPGVGIVIEIKSVV